MTITMIGRPIMRRNVFASGGGGGPVSWRPPEGYFADIPVTNHPSDVFTTIYGSVGGLWQILFLNWTSGAVLRDFSTLGAMAINGAGHEPSYSSPNLQGTFILDFDTLLWSFVNAVVAPNLAYVGGNPAVPNTDVHGEFPDESNYSGHTYDGLQELRTSEGGGVKGSLVCFNSFSGVGGAGQATHKYDVSQATGGYSRFSTTADGSLGGGTYPIAVKDEARGGFWLTMDTLASMKLINNDGTFNRNLANQNYNNAVNSGLALWPAKDLLMVIGGGSFNGYYAAGGASQIFMYDLAHSDTRTVAQVTGIPPQLRVGYTLSEQIASISVVSGGSGYAVNDVVTFANGANGATSAAKVIVSSVSGGAITGTTFADQTITTGFTIEQRGWYGTRLTNNFSQASTSGGGTGATFSATWEYAVDYLDIWQSNLTWSEILGCLVGFDESQGEVVTLTPPTGYTVGNTSAWEWGRISVSHWAAGDPGGQSSLNVSDPPNGAYGKFRYVESLNAFVNFSLPTDQVNYKPQIITLPGLG